MDCCINDVLSLLDGVLYKCPVSAHGTNLKAFSFDPNYDTIPLEEFIPMLGRIFSRDPYKNL